MDRTGTGGDTEEKGVDDWLEMPRNGVRPISGYEVGQLLLLIFCAEPLTQKA